KDRVNRLEKSRTPRRNSKTTARTNVAPKLPHSSLHVRHEEDSEDTNDGIEPGGWQLQIEHIASAKFDVVEVPLLGLRTRECQQVLCEIHAENEALPSDGLRRRNCGSSAAATHIEDACSRVDE